MFRKHLTLFPGEKKTKLLHHDPNKSHMKNGLTYMTDVRGGERAKKLIKLKHRMHLSTSVDTPLLTVIAQTHAPFPFPPFPFP